MASVGNLLRRFNPDSNNKYITQILYLIPMLVMNIPTNFACSNVDKSKILIFFLIFFILHPYCYICNTGPVQPYTTKP